MSGAVPGTRSPGHGGGAHGSVTHDGGPSGGHGHEPREGWPRDWGRDGVSGLVTLDRALRARDVSRPDAEDERVAHEVLGELLARVDGRRSAGRRPPR